MSMDPLHVGGTPLLKEHVAAIQVEAFQLVRREMSFRNQEWSPDTEAILRRAIEEECVEKLGSLDNAKERLAEYTDEIEGEAWQLIESLLEIKKTDGPEGVAQYVRDAIQDEVLRKGILRQERLKDEGEEGETKNELQEIEVDESKLTEKMVPYNQRRDEVIGGLEDLLGRRNSGEVRKALEALRTAALENRNTMPYFIDAALANATVGEMMDVMREIFGDYKKGVFPSKTTQVSRIQKIESPRPIRILTAKPGLDGHDRGLNLVSAVLKNAGLEVIYGGLRQTPQMIARTAVQENVDFIGISSLSGARIHFIQDLMGELKKYGAEKRIKVIVGGITEDDGPYLTYLGVDAIFDPNHRTGELHHILGYIQNWIDQTFHNRDSLPIELTRILDLSI